MSHDAPTELDLAAGLSGSHRWALARIFQHPISHNVSWREVSALITTIGTVEGQHNGNFMLRIGELNLLMKPSHAKDLDATEVMDLRRLLLRGGWSANGINPDPILQAAS